MISVMISILMAPAIGRGRWAIPPRLIKDRTLRDELQHRAQMLQKDIENMREQTPQRNPQLMLKDFKMGIRDTLRKHEKKTQPILKEKIEKLTASL